jgi:hypothetical protein
MLLFCRKFYTLHFGLCIPGFDGGHPEKIGTGVFTPYFFGVHVGHLPKLPN